MTKVFTILGTGWLGYALAQKLKDTYTVKVSIRNKEKYKDLKSEGFEPYILSEDSTENIDELLNCDYLFINYPPSKFKDYIGFLNKIYTNKNIKIIKKLFFISSTSIYPALQYNYDEDFEIEKEQSKKIVFEAETVASQSDVIFRCAGLMGYNRVAGKYFSNKKLTTLNKKINHVHRDDVIRATLFAIENDINGVFNLCSKYHPLRNELYINNAKKYGFKQPIFEINNNEIENRVIDGSKIESLGFRYKYENPMNYL